MQNLAIFFSTTSAPNVQSTTYVQRAEYVFGQAYQTSDSSSFKFSMERIAIAGFSLAVCSSVNMLAHNLMQVKKLVQEGGALDSNVNNDIIYHYSHWVPKLHIM